MGGGDRGLFEIAFALIAVVDAGGFRWGLILTVLDSTLSKNVNLELFSGLVCIAFELVALFVDVGFAEKDELEVGRLEVIHVCSSTYLCDKHNRL